MLRTIFRCFVNIKERADALMVKKHYDTTLQHVLEELERIWLEPKVLGGAPTEHEEFSLHFSQ